VIYELLYLIVVPTKWIYSSKSPLSFPLRMVEWSWWLWQVEVVTWCSDKDWSLIGSGLPASLRRWDGFRTSPQYQHQHPAGTRAGFYVTNRSGHSLYTNRKCLEINIFNIIYLLFLTPHLPLPDDPSPVSLTVWNCLPTDVQSSPSQATCKRRLETHLFDITFNLPTWTVMLSNELRA